MERRIVQWWFGDWEALDSVDAWERERARRIEAIQGNRNPFTAGQTRPAMTTSTDRTPAASGSIIGNRSSKVYHRLECPSYDQVAPQNRVLFTSEAEAQAAGYRVAGICP